MLAPPPNGSSEGHWGDWPSEARTALPHPSGVVSLVWMPGVGRDPSRRCRRSCPRGVPPWSAILLHTVGAPRRSPPVGRRSPTSVPPDSGRATRRRRGESRGEHPRGSGHGPTGLVCCGTQQPSGIRGVLLARPGINCLLVVALRGQVKPTCTGYVGGRRQWVALRGWAAVLCLGPWGAMRAAPMPSLPPGARRRVPANDRSRLCDHQGVTPPRPAATASFCGLRATATRVSLVSGARRPAIPRWQAGGPWLIR